MTRLFTKMIGVISIVGALYGCAVQPEYEGVTFLNAPEDISSVWMSPEGGVYLVPEKGVVIDQAVDEMGRPITLEPVGAYLVMSRLNLGSAKEVRFLIERRWRRLDLIALSDAPKAK